MDPGRPPTTSDTVPRTLPDSFGPLLFARYAYAPNERGYCGPTDHRELLEYGAARVVDAGIVQIAQAFNGAWPYLQLLAESSGLDPLDRRVVEAYWVGNRLLDEVPTALMGNSLEERFRRRAGPGWDRLAESIPAGGVPHHSFHVFCVYPWVGLLRPEDRGGQPLEILDRCRIRWGQAVAVAGDEVAVRSRPLEWDGRRLLLGAPRVETVVKAIDGLGFVQEVQVGDWVSMHWGWVCDRLSPRGRHALRAYSRRTLEMVNHRLAHPGPAVILG
ncbi:MAG: DUF6390 family protein [Egibacteraceae bacterium]